MSSDNNSTYKDTFNLRSYFEYIWDQKTFIVSLALLSAIVASIFSFTLKDVYTSTSVVYVVEDQDSGGMGSLLSQYSSLASSAGVSLPSNTTSKTDIFLATINSKDFFLHLLKFEGIREKLFAFESYDEMSRNVIFNEEIFDSSNNEWISGTPDDLLVFYKFIEDEILNVTHDKVSQMITISVTHVSPKFAYEFCQLVIREINNLIRLRHLEESTSALTFLNEQYGVNPQKNIRESIGQLIEAQMKIQMLANVRKDYMIRPIDKPFSPIAKSFPYRLQITILGLMAGIFIGIFISLFRLYIDQSK